MPIIKTDHICNENIQFDKCILNIQITLKTYKDLKKFYYIFYTWTYENNNINNNPLIHDTEFIENNITGDIIAQNDMTDKLISFLTMDNNELQKICGNCEVMTYKLQIIKTISIFWD